MCDHRLLTVVFKGASGGNPRVMEAPAQSVGDFPRVTGYPVTLLYVDAGQHRRAQSLRDDGYAIHAAMPLAVHQGLGHDCCGEIRAPDTRKFQSVEPGCCAGGYGCPEDSGSARRILADRRFFCPPWLK